MKTIVLAGGCFWCVEAVFQRIKGVKKVVSGYAGGTQTNPTYHEHGDHAEVVQVSYDQAQIDLEKLLEIFFYVHDPTTLNRQGNDVGTQYRSAILCDNATDLQKARQAKENARTLWPDPLVTEIEMLAKFYPAEDYHQNYYNQNPGNSYCQVIINPKLAKFETKFAADLST